MDLFEDTDIKDCYIFKSHLFKDNRGSFSKIFSTKIFKELGYDIPVAEVFFSNSFKNVIRGMHFQAPPHDQVKVVSCLNGRILDVVLDLRSSSPSYGKSIGIELTATNETTLIIPKGCAHGFYTYEDNSIVGYVVETAHNKQADQGILWNSFGFKWPSENPILSSRDSEFLSFSSSKNLFK